MVTEPRSSDPLRPESPPHPGWQPDPWGDGERYWDGEIWTRRTRSAGATDPQAPDEVVAPSAPARPRHWELVEDADDEPRPLRSGMQRAMIWAFAVVALLALVLATMSSLPHLLGGAGAPATEVPQRSAQLLLYSIGSFNGSV